MIKNIYRKIKAWIAVVFKKFEFDNTLFAKGIDFVVKQLVEKLKGIEFKSAEDLAWEFYASLEDKFKKLSPILVLLKPAIGDVLGAIEDKFNEGKLTTEKKVMAIGQEIIVWYDENY